MQTAQQTDTRRELFTTAQAADYLGIKANSLITWRSTKAVRIPYVKIGGCVRYRKADLDSYIEENLEG